MFDAKRKTGNCQSKVQKQHLNGQRRASAVHLRQLTSTSRSTPAAELRRVPELCRRVHRIDDNALRMQRARTFKVYLTNPAIRAALFGMTGDDDDAVGNLAETAVWS